MPTMLTLAGYQGARSVHTRALRILAGWLADLSTEFDVSHVPDVTVEGRSARSLLDEVEHQPGLVAYMASSYLTARVPELAVLDLPFPSADRAQAYAALDGPPGESLQRAVATRTGYRVLGLWDNGVRHLSNRIRPIRSVDDCAGLVIRTLDNATYQDTLRAFGFEPVVTDVRDLVAAVRSGAVDAQENPLTNLLTFGLQADQPHVSLTGHLAGVALLLCSEAWFATLPAAVASALQQAADHATAEQRGLAITEDVTARASLAAAGVQILSAEEIALDGFRTAADPIRRRILSGLDPALVRAWR